MENIIVIAIVIGAAAWAGRRFFSRRKASGCAAGCGGCGAAERPPRLIQIKR
jgi:hypothetical protein